MGNRADDKAKEEWCKELATKRMGTPEGTKLIVNIYTHITENRHYIEVSEVRLPKSFEM